MAASLTDIVSGVRLSGVVPGREVTVIDVERHGTEAITVTYREPDGSVNQRLLYRTDEPNLTVLSSSETWNFDADGELFRLVSEARRIQLAHLFDPLLAVHLSKIEPLPHQIRAVYEEMLPRQPLRFVLAHDPGAGKTIMAGLYLKELILRADVARCLVVAPGGLVTQWQDELAERFALRFEIVTSDMIEALYSGNPFAERDFLIARMDHLARNEKVLERLRECEWDLVIVDEAHRMSAHYQGDEVKETRRYRLGKLLSERARHFLLLTGTPHTGKEEDFQLFLALVDQDRFEGRQRTYATDIDTTDVLSRLSKEKLLRFDGRPLFPERHASTVPFELSPLEHELYEAVTKYVVEEMNRAERLGGSQRSAVGFALTVLQRRLASSPEAIFRSLQRRRERLENQLEATRTSASSVQWSPTARAVVEESDEADEVEEWEAAEIEEAEEELVEKASAAQNVVELQREVQMLRALEARAEAVRRSEEDRKWVALRELLTEKGIFTPDTATPPKLIIFTEHRDTLEYLQNRLQRTLGRPDTIVSIHGGMHRDERRKVQERFSNDPDCRILVATDAAGEGINLQRANLVVNYDLPWNPNRLEQRFGRVHRIGQDKPCYMWNLVAINTREGRVYELLLEKLEEQRKRFGDQVFDVLGQALPGQQLRDLLLQAIREGESPRARAYWEQVIDARVGEGLGELLRERALASDMLTTDQIAEVQRMMEEAAARRLQPHYVQSFFVEAFTKLGGQIRLREKDRFEITRVPGELQSVSKGIRPVVGRYERVCFDKDLARLPGSPEAEVLAPGHPLLDAVAHVFIERHGDLLRRGTVLVDESDIFDKPRILCYLDHSIADGRTDSAGRPHIVSRRFVFVAITESGEGTDAGYAPYLDYRPATRAEADRACQTIEGSWLLPQKVESAAKDFAIKNIVPRHLHEVQTLTESRVARTWEAVERRLTREINYWDARANTLWEEQRKGLQPRMNPENARRRADELKERLERRRAELDAERHLQARPPVLVGAALVVPAHLLAGDSREVADHARERREVEQRAVAAVVDAEKALGRNPEVMPPGNPGFDIRSIDADGHLLFLEVKGRITGADTVTLTRNELLTALNTRERFILALVDVSPHGTEQVRYLRDPAEELKPTLYGAERSITYDWRQLWERSGAPR